LRPAEISESDICKQISRERLQSLLGINTSRGAGRTLGFEFSFVLGAKKNGAAEVAQFNSVHVDDDDVTDAEQREIFYDFISERTRAGDEHARIAQQGLFPPLNRFESGKAALAQVNRWSGRAHITS
jgi:hypothetical protein